MKKHHQPAEDQQQQQLIQYSKLHSSQGYLQNVVVYFLFFGSGLVVGLTLSFYLRDLPQTLNFKQFSSDSMALTTSATAPPVPPPPPPPRVGLREYLRVEKTTQDMTEAELLWRASMKPKIEKFPFRWTPKVAFIFRPILPHENRWAGPRPYGSGPARNRRA